MVDNEVDEIVDKILELMEIDDIEDEKNVIYRFLNRKEYMKHLINGEITNTQRKIHDLIEECQLTDNKKFMIKLIKLGCPFSLGCALKYTIEELRNDKGVVLEVVKQDGYALEYASEELRNDKEVVLEAVKQNRYVLQYASEELQNDKELKRLCEEYFNYWLF